MKKFKYGVFCASLYFSMILDVIVGRLIVYKIGIEEKLSFKVKKVGLFVRIYFLNIPY